VTTSTTSVQGVPELVAKLKGLSADLQQKALRTPLRRGAELVRDSAKAKVPVRTGALKDSLRVTSRSSRKTGFVKAQVKDGMSYGKFVEKGYIAESGRHIPGHAFMLSAFEQTSHQIVDIVSAALTKQLAKMRKKGVIT
jgi:HK97 gp10 family phage protein